MPLNTEFFTEARVQTDADMTIRRVWSIMDCLVTLKTYGYNDFRRADQYTIITEMVDDIIARQQQVRADLGLTPELVE